MKEVILSYKGSVPCHLIFESDEAKGRLPLGDGFHKSGAPICGQN